MGSALLQYPLFQAFDDDGDPLTGGLLYTYVTGTTTNKTTYSDKGLASANANPVVLDSRGEAQVYFTGTIKLVLKDSAGATIWTEDDIEGVGQTHAIYYADASEADQGAAGGGNSIKDLVDSIGAKSATIVLAHTGTGNTTTYTLLTAETIPANITLSIQNGAIIQPAASITLTVYSPENILASPQQQIIDTTNNSTNPLLFTNPGKVFVGWLGAVGDGSTDDTTAISVGLTASEDGVLEFISGVTYKTTALITKTGSFSMCASGSRPAKIYASSSYMAFSFVGSAASVSTTLSVEAEIGDATIALTSATGVVAGMLLHLTSDVLWYWDNRGTAYKGEVHRVRSVAGSVVTLDHPVDDNYDISGAETVTVKGYAEKHFSMENVEIYYDSPDDHTVIVAARYMHPRFDNVVLKNADAAGLQLNYCFGAEITSSKITLNADITDGLGYGIQDAGSFGTIVTGCEFLGCRRGVDFSGTTPARGWIVDSCVASNQLTETADCAGFSTHGPAENGVFSNNIINGCRYGFLTRGNNISIIGNRGTSRILGEFIVATYGNNLHIAGNSLGDIAQRTELTLDDGNQRASLFLEIGSNFDAGGRVTVVGNEASVAYTFIYSTITVNWFVNGNNTYLENESSGAAVYFMQIDALANSSVYGNRYTKTTGIRNVYKSTTTFDWDTIEVDNIELEDTDDLVVHAGSGTLANKELKLNVHIIKGTAYISGWIELDIVTDTAKIRINGLPDALTNNFYGLGHSDGATYSLYIANGTGSSPLYIGPDGTGYDGSFAVGTDYGISLDFSYPIYTTDN